MVEASLASSVHTSLLLLLNVQYRAIQILEVPCLILHLLRVVVSNVLGAGCHLLLHEVLGRGES